MTKTQWHHLCRHTNAAALQKRCLNVPPLPSPTYSLQCIFPAFVWWRKTCLSLNHYPPFYPSVHLIFQSGPSVCLSAGITLCSPFFLAENISMWSWAHLSEPDGCLSNCHSPLPRPHRSRLNTKKGQRTLAWFKAPRMAHTNTHTQSCHHPKTFHVPIITPRIFTLAPSPTTSVLQHLYNIRAVHTYIVWWEMRPKCCSQPSGWPRDLIYA